MSSGSTIGVFPNPKGKKMSKDEWRTFVMVVSRILRFAASQLEGWAKPPPNQDK